MYYYHHRLFARPVGLALDGFGWLDSIVIIGKKVLHMDRNDYYGGESASLNLTQVSSELSSLSFRADLLNTQAYF